VFCSVRRARIYRGKLAIEDEKNLITVEEMAKNWG